VVSRRRFLFLVGSAAPGLWLGGTGLLQLQRRFAVALGGSCSFCGKRATDVSTLAGVVTRSVRICDECVSLCCDILAEESLDVRGENHSSPSDDVVSEDELSQLLRSLDKESAPKIDGILSALRRRLDGDRLKSIHDFQCSFCDADRRDVAKLISGPRVFICDACVGDATALVSNILRV
jgi:hypothetical protein